MWVPAWGDEIEVLAFLATLLQSSQVYALGMGKAMLTHTGAWCEDWPAYCVSGLGMEFVITQVWACALCLLQVSVAHSCPFTLLVLWDTFHVLCSELLSSQLPVCLQLWETTH